MRRGKRVTLLFCIQSGGSLFLLFVDPATCKDCMLSRLVDHGSPHKSFCISRRGGECAIVVTASNRAALFAVSIRAFIES